MKTFTLSIEECQILETAIDDIIYRLFETKLEDASLMTKEREGYLELLRLKKLLKS